MSYIGGPLPGQEVEEQEDDNLLEMWKEKRIGRETLQSAKDLASQSPEWLKRSGHLLGEVVQDMSTLEGNEKYHPGHLITWGVMKGLQGVGVVTDTVIGKPVSWTGHNVLGLDKDVANLTGDVTEAIVTPFVAGKVVKGINTAVGTTKSLLGGGITANAGTGLIKESVYRRVNIPQTRGVKITNLRQEIYDWYGQQLKAKNLPISKYKQIKREHFGNISIGNEDRVISQIGQALKQKNPDLIKLPKVKTVKLLKEKRFEATRPPAINDMFELADDIGMPRKFLEEWRENAAASFSSVQTAAKRTSKFTSEVHAGHFTAAQSKPLAASELYRSPKLGSAPTTGRAAGLEHYLKNIRGSNKVAHDINIHAAKRAGIPITWADDLKMWWKIKQGKPVLDYASDFTIAERNIIEAIPYKATKSQVEKVFKKIYSDRKKLNPDLGSYTNWAEEISRDL